MLTFFYLQGFLRNGPYHFIVNLLYTADQSSFLPRLRFNKAKITRILFYSAGLIDGIFFIIAIF